MTDLVVSGLHKAFASTLVLKGVDLDVPAGSFTAILGPSGSGKTTLLRVVAGFERADAGTVTLGGDVVDGGERFVAANHRRIGYVPQEGLLFPHLTVARNVGFGLSRAVRAATNKVDRLLEMVGLTGLGKRYPHQLSGGQQQRVALARALAIEPEIVLLDEPFSSLDAGLRASVRDDVRQVLRKAGATVVLVTHDQDEALSMSDRVAVIRDGRIGQIDTPETLYCAPADLELAGFVGEANVLRGVLSPGADRVRTLLGNLALRQKCQPFSSSQKVQVLVRPEQIELEPRPGPGDVTGEVLDYRYFGHDAVIRVCARPGGEMLVVRVNGGDAWEPGAVVGLEVNGSVLAWPVLRESGGDGSVASTPLALTPVTQTPVTQTPVTQTPVTQTPVTQTPVTQTPVAPSAFDSVDAGDPRPAPGCRLEESVSPALANEMVDSLDDHVIEAHVRSRHNAS